MKADLTPTPFRGRIAAMVMIAVGLVWALPMAHGQGARKGEGTLSITSKPGDLEFEVFNAERGSVQRGLTPATVEGLAAGDYQVIVRQRGRVAQRYAVAVRREAVAV